MQLELRSLGRPTRSQSLYLLSYLLQTGDSRPSVSKGLRTRRRISTKFGIVALLYSLSKPSSQGKAGRLYQTDTAVSERKHLWSRLRIPNDRAVLTAD
jgi:hypothetical protein